MTSVGQGMVLNAMGQSQRKKDWGWEELKLLPNCWKACTMDTLPSQADVQNAKQQAKPGKMDGNPWCMY